MRHLRPSTDLKTFDTSPSRRTSASAMGAGAEAAFATWVAEAFGRLESLYSGKVAAPKNGRCGENGPSNAMENEALF